MRSKGRVAVITVLTLSGGLVAYGVADAYDVVPGVLTLEPEPIPPAPFAQHAPVLVADVPPSPVAALSDAAPMPSFDAVQALAVALRADSRTGNSTNVAVQDMLTGEVLADLDASETQVPASTTKHLTAVAALSALGPDFTTETAVTWDSASSQLTLVAGGDMMLAAEYGHHGEIRHANGWAGLADLADAVADSIGELGDQAVTLVVDDSAFPGPLINPEWPQYAVTMGYVAGVSGLAVDVARIDSEANYSQRHRDPSLAAAEQLAELLAERNVTIDSVNRGENPSGSIGLAEVQSAPLSLVVEYLMHISDNTVAENLGRVLAIEQGYPATPAGAASATIEQLERIGAPVDGLELYDSAGFSTRNRISPLHLTGATRAAVADPNAARYLDHLAIAGAEGTVEVRYVDTPPAGFMRAKTGSLTGVTALTGVMTTADGRLLAFALLADGMPQGQDRPRAAFDDFLYALAECGCRQ